LAGWPDKNADRRAFQWTQNSSHSSAPDLAPWPGRLAGDSARAGAWATREAAGFAEARHGRGAARSRIAQAEHADGLRQVHLFLQAFAAAAACSTRAAFCCVMVSMCVTAVLISPMPALCSRLA
jgi:hypothetical protein